MANSWTSTGNVTLVSDSLRTVGSIATTLTINGVLNAAQTTNVTGSTWTALVTGSNYRAGYFVNQGDALGSGSIVFASGSAGQNSLFKLLVNDSTTHYWDGTTQLPLYAQVAAGTSTASVVLQYQVTTS